MVFMQPLADGSFAELSRRPNAPSRNQPLALYMMEYADLLLQESKESKDIFPLLSHIYFKALMHHNGLPALNLRIMWSLLAQNRDLESISFAYSSLAWPSLKFTPEIWLFCRDSIFEEILIDESEEDKNNALAPHLGLLLIKTRLLQQLHERRAQCHLFLHTKLGQMLNPVQLLLEEFLGATPSILKGQEGQLNTLWESWDERYEDSQQLWRHDCHLLSLLPLKEARPATDMPSLSDRQVVLALLSKLPR